MLDQIGARLIPFLRRREIRAASLYALAAILVTFAVVRPMPAVACAPGECFFPQAGICAACSKCNGPNQCLQGDGSVCNTCNGPCQPRNDGLQGCGGPAVCINNTFPCTQDGVITCCSCEGLLCGTQCCRPDLICIKSESGDACSNFPCPSGVGCYGQCCAKGEACDPKTLSCFTGPTPLCRGGEDGVRRSSERRASVLWNGTGLRNQRTRVLRLRPRKKEKGKILHGFQYP
jgi:hypothetical protein